VALTDRTEHLAFQAAEARFAIPIEDVRDAAARRLFDHGIGIHKAVAQAFGQGAARARLAAAHHSHQIEAAPGKTLLEGGGGIRHDSETAIAH